MLQKTNTNLGIDFSLIRVIDGRVDARNLYEFLDLSRRQFSRWAKINILENPFAEGEYMTFDIMSNGNKTTNYYLTVPFAKKLSMQAKTVMGEKAREYFLKCESKLVEKKPKQLSRIELLEMAMDSERQRLKLEHELEQAKPAIEFTKTVSNAINSITIQEFAKICGTGRIRMFTWLRENEYLMQNNQPYQRYLENGYFKFVEKSYQKNGEDYVYFQTLVTGKGQINIQKKWLETPVLLEINNQN